MSYYVSRKGDRPHPIAVQRMDLLRPWTALRCMALGTATRAEWSDLSDAINMIEALCEMGRFEPEVVMPYVVISIEGMQYAMKHDMRMPEMYLLALGYVVERYDDALFKLAENTLNTAADMVRAAIKQQAIAPQTSDLVVMA